MAAKWALIKGRGDRDGKRTEQHVKADAGEGSIFRTVKAAVTRGGGRR